MISHVKEVKQMTKQEYERIQKDLDNIMKDMKHMSLSSLERWAYKEAVLACKSALSNYNPEKR
jgi:hypothetical protein